MNVKPESDIEQHLRSHADRVNRLAEALPDLCVEQSRDRLLQSLSTAAHRPSWTERLHGVDPLIVWGTGLAALLLAAFIAVLAWPRDWQACSVAVQSVPAAGPLVAADATADINASLADAASAISAGIAGERSGTVSDGESDVLNAASSDADPAVSLAVLRAEFERLKATGAGVDNAFLVRLVDHIVSVKDRQSEEFAGLRLLLVETYEQMGERDRALAAYKRYLDVVEQREGADAAARLAWERANDLFRLRGERAEALGYYDLVISRYPGTLLAREARLMPAQYFELDNMWGAAADAYGRVAQSGLVDGPTARRAMRRQSVMLANAGDHDGANRVLQEALAGAETPCEEAETRFQIGCRYYFRGEMYYPAALQEFRRVLELNTAAHQRDTKRMLARIRSAATAGVGDILLN